MKHKSTFEAEELQVMHCVPQKCIYSAKQRSFLAFVDSRSILNMSGRRFIQSVGVMDQEGAVR